LIIYNKLSEIQLLALVKKGDEAAFKVCYERFRPLIFRYALRICKSADAVEEIVQNVMLKVWLQRAQLNTELNFKGWIARVSANESFDFLKKLAREKALGEKVWLNMQGQQLYSEDEYVLKDYLKLVENAISKLPPQQQKVYRLSREQYLTYDQIADQLNISSNTVRNHIAIALETIRKNIAREATCVIPAAIAMCIILGNR